MTEITLQYRNPSTGEWREHTLEKEETHSIGNVIVAQPTDSIGKRGKVRIHLDSGDVFHHDPRFSGHLRSTQIGELAKVH